MKFRIHLSPNTEAVPFNYAHQLCGIFHHWLGPNELHDMLSLYSLGWLRSGRASGGGLWFSEGTSWDIGIHNDAIAERLVRGLLLKDFRFYGMEIRRVTPLAPPDFSSGRHRFLSDSPVLLRRVEDDQSRTHVTFKDPDSSRILQQRIRRKAEEAQLPEAAALRLRFDPAYRNPKTKLVRLKTIDYRASVCPLLAEGTPEALQFLWTVGAGEMTGVGFGSLGHTGRLDGKGAGRAEEQRSSAAG
ncbi:MAG: CRISPR-associated endoribonuclease Cas6 [Candidatus Cyclonatronum sp.]|uniref:CRISPR-associated endoribonuclease Cas6 n=1 Tax=Cyclonatronum sp. TaxID=3024185 RepID=UPI0025B8529A|nr:CRISPR-associated endoribonuclease Cas6 [Cyclonatronum sp.]MCC5935326.1 CRISPR-associated endoribonuclease Cas6 [Balneolales bacterium]MCH8487471.1 CRISPR-associated endoribonuclease Cas6 [Cyclonatronum sp.]